MIYLKSELLHHGVKGQKWGVRRQMKRQAVIQSAAQKAQRQASMYRTDAKNFNKYKASKSDKARWVKASKSAEKYYLSKQSEFSKMSSNKISRAQVKDAKKWLKDNYTHVEADYADVHTSKGTTNYLLDYDKRR